MATGTTTATTVTSPADQAQQQGGPRAAAAAAVAVGPQAVADMKAAFGPLRRELSYDLPADLVDGAIPPELAGTYYRNGPVLLASAGLHPFDGDGCPVSICFPGGGAPPRFRNAFVRTPGFVEEQRAGAPRLRTAFTRGTPGGGRWANPLDLLNLDSLKNVSNTGLLQWQGKLLSLYESHRPHELSPADLSTVGETDLGGQLRSPRLAAHYRVTAENGRGGGGRGPPGSAAAADAATARGVEAAGGSAAAEDEARRWVAFSANSGPGGSKILFYEFLGGQLPGAAAAAAGGTSASGGGPELVRPPVEHALPDSPVALVHDIAVTRDYYVVYESPLRFNVKKFAWEYLALQTASVAECLEFAREQPARVHFVPRPGGRAAGSRALVAEAPARFCFHCANAFQLDVEVGEEGGEGAGAKGKAARVRVALDAALWDDVSFSLTQRELTPAYYDGGSRSQLRRLVFDLGPADEVAGTTSGAAAGAAVGAGAAGGAGAGGAPGGARLVSDTNLLRRSGEFPSVDWARNGRAARCAYLAVDAVDDARLWGPAQAIAKVTIPPTLGFSPAAAAAGSQGGAPAAVGEAGPARATAEGVQSDVWAPGPRYIVGEPLFVPRPGRDEGPEGEDDGWVLVACQNAETGRGEVAILDARRLSRGPVARLRLPHYLPSGLHGSFTQGGLESLSAPVGPPRPIREYV